MGSAVLLTDAAGSSGDVVRGASAHGASGACISYGRRPGPSANVAARIAGLVAERRAPCHASVSAHTGLGVYGETFPSSSVCEPATSGESRAASSAVRVRQRVEACTLGFESEGMRDVLFGATSVGVVLRDACPTSAGVWCVELLPAELLRSPSREKEREMRRMRVAVRLNGRSSAGDVLPLGMSRVSSGLYARAVGGGASALCAASIATSPDATRRRVRGKNDRGASHSRSAISGTYAPVSPGAYACAGIIGHGRAVQGVVHQRPPQGTPALRA